MTVPASSVSPGRLLVTGRYLAVLDGTRARRVRQRGRRPHVRASGPAAPAPRSPRCRPGWWPTSATAASACSTRSPAEWHPLRTQPMPHARSVATGRPHALRRRPAGHRAGRWPAAGTPAAAGGATPWSPVPYRTPELALVAGADGSAYLVVTRTLPAGEPGVVQVWRSAGRSWTRLVDYSDVDQLHAEVHHRGRRAQRRHPAGRRVGRRPGRATTPAGRSASSCRGARSATRRWFRPCCAAAAARSPRSPRTAVTCWSGTTTRPPGRFCSFRTESNRSRAVNLDTWPGRTCSAAARTPRRPPAAGWSSGSCSRWPSAIPALLDTVRGPGPPPPAAPTPVATIEAPPGHPADRGLGRRRRPLGVRAGRRVRHPDPARLRLPGVPAGPDRLRAGHRRRCTSPAATTTGLDVTMRVTPDDDVLLGGRHRHAGLRRRRRHRTQPPPAHRARRWPRCRPTPYSPRSCARPAPTG